MPHRLAALIFAVSIASSALAEDCANCVQGKICLTHEATDDIAVRDAEIRLKTKDMMGKREAVNGLADAQMKHLNVRSKKITLSLLKALFDTDVDVKALAAEKLTTVGDPATAAAGIGQEVTKLKKLIGNSKPRKANELPAWETNLKQLKQMYESLGAVKDPAVSKIFENDVMEPSQWIGLAAAEGCVAVKGSRGLVKALYDAMKKWLGPSTHAPVPEGSAECFHGMSHAMAAVVENAPKLEGKNQNESMALWDSWWKTNGAKYEDKK